MKKFFSYKLHFIFLVLLASAASSVAVVMKLNLGLEQSKQSQVRSEAIHKMNPFKHLVSLKIEEIRNDLLNFALARKTHEATPQFGLFNSIALVQLSGTEFAPKWIESVRNNEVWTNEYRSAALKTLAFQKIEESGFVWSKYQEGNNKPV